MRSNYISATKVHPEVFLETTVCELSEKLPEKRQMAKLVPIVFYIFSKESP